MSKINNTFVDKTKDLDTVMPMYNLLEYNNNYSITLGNLWNYLNELKYKIIIMKNDAGNYRRNNDKTTASKYLE